MIEMVTPTVVLAALSFAGVAARSDRSRAVHLAAYAAGLALMLSLERRHTSCLAR